MSQKKVIEYKEEKRNRKEVIKKQKRASMIKNVVACLVVVLVVGTVGFAFYKKTVSNNNTDANTVDLTSINDYIDTLNLNEAMVVDDDSETTSDAVEENK